MHDLAPGIHFHGLTRLLLSDQCVSVYQALTTEDLMRVADVIEHRLAARSDLTHSRGCAAVTEENISIWQHLEDDRGARWLEFPDHLPIGIEFDEAVRPLAILGEEDAVFDGLVCGGASRAKRQSEGEKDNKESSGMVHWLS